MKFWFYCFYLYILWIYLLCFVHIENSVSGNNETEKASVSGGPVSQPSQDSSEAEPNHFDDTVEPMVLLAPDVAAGLMAFLMFYPIFIHIS